jgi:hypothetical protein
MSVTREQVVEYGGRAVLVNTPASAVRALELVGLGKAFAIHRIDGEQALRTVLGSATEQEPILVRALAARPRTSASSPA